MNGVKGLGFRQRTILGLLDGRATVPTGYLVRVCGCDPRTVYVALAGLEQRGLVRHVSWGRWAAA